MDHAASLTLFSHVVSRPEADLDLLEAALLIADHDYPGLDHPHYSRQMDTFAAGVRKSLPSGDEVAKIRALLAYVYEELGFHGNRDDYYDPRNSFLNEVIDRRMGIPISLAVVLIEIGRRAGFEARGISFPGHFLVRIEATRGLVVADPFEGKLLDRGELRALHQRSTGEQTEPNAKSLEPATKRQILLRMLTNLRGVYAEKNDVERLRIVIERMQVLSPSDELREELKRLGGRMPWPSGNRAVN